MILIKNSQRKVLLNLHKIKQEIKQILKILVYEDFDIGIWFTSEIMIRKYNKKYRRLDKATDVLSFPYHANLKAGEQIHVFTPDDKNLGDIIISPHVVAKDAIDADIPFDQQLQRVLIHAVLHLLGYDHIKDSDYKIMYAKEKKLFEKLNS